MTNDGIADLIRDAQAEFLQTTVGGVQWVAGGQKPGHHKKGHRLLDDAVLELVRPEPPPDPEPEPSAGLLGCGWFFTSMANWQIRGDRLSSEFTALNGGVVKGVRFYPIMRASPSSGGYWNGNGGQIRTAVVVNGTEVGHHLVTDPRGQYGNGGPILVPVSGTVPKGAHVAVQWTNPAANPGSNTVSIDNLGCPRDQPQPGAAENGLAFFVNGSKQSHHVPIVEVVYESGLTDGGSGYIDVPGSAARSGSADIPLNLPRDCSKVHVYGVTNIRATVDGRTATDPGGPGWNTLDLAVAKGPRTLHLTYSGTLKAFQKGTGYGFADPSPEMPGGNGYPVTFD